MRELIRAAEQATESKLKAENDSAAEVAEETTPAIRSEREEVKVTTGVNGSSSVNGDDATRPGALASDGATHP